MNNKFQETITIEEIQDYDLSWFKGEIVIVDNLKTIQQSNTKASGMKKFWVLIPKPGHHSEKGRKTKYPLFSWLTGTLPASSE